MNAIDWSQPIEAVHDDGRVCPATKVYGETSWRCDGHWWHSNRIDGTTGFDGWRIRNVAQPAAEAPTAPSGGQVGPEVVERMIALVSRMAETKALKDTGWAIDARAIVALPEPVVLAAIKRGRALAAGDRHE